MTMTISITCDDCGASAETSTSYEAGANEIDGARLDEHLRLLGQPGALTAVLNYYRAYRPETGLALGPIPVPTTYVWGNTDVAFGRRAAEGTADFVEAPYTFVELDEGHWISDLQPEPLADAILARVRE